MTRMDQAARAALPARQWQVVEVATRSGTEYANPFVDVAVWVDLSRPDGTARRIPGFYDGESTWRVRFSVDLPGRWEYRIQSYPANPDLQATGRVEVEPEPGRGFLRSTPGRAWGFHYDSGEPVFFLGDTVYNLFGMAHCGGDVESFLKRRASQGFNLLRVRLPVSPFHPPEGYSSWQTRRTWPWGGSEQSPRFDRLNLDYFQTVDQVVRSVEDLGLGLEMIMEAWGFEFPFNSRSIFVPEWEELWLRYLIARYDAYRCVYFWNPQNEYEYYPNGDWHYKPVADRWAIRVARWIRATAQHGHVVAIHNGPREPAFASRFAADPEAIDTIMFQDWGTRDERDGWLAAGIEDQIERSLDGWPGSAIFAEYGYERNPELPLLIPGHKYCDVDHTRRGAWRGAFRALGVIHGFDNSWGPFMVLDRDQAGMADLLQVRRFFVEVVPFHRLRPAPEVVAPGDWGFGRRPLALASDERDVVAVYLPIGGTVKLSLPGEADRHQARWFDPRTGELSPAAARDGRTFEAPTGGGERPLDWVLLLTS